MTIHSQLPMVSEQDRQKRHLQNPISIILNCEDPIETAVALEQQLFRSGHTAVVVRAEDALAVCPYVEAAGLIAIVAGNQSPIPFGLHFESNNTSEIIAQLIEQQVLLNNLD